MHTSSAVRRVVGVPVVKEPGMGRKHRGYVVVVSGKYLTPGDDTSGRPKLTRMLSRAAVYPGIGEAMAAQDRLRGDQAQHASIALR